MKNEVLDILANEIVEKLSGKLNVKDEMKEFLLSEISKENKEKTLEQLYLFQLYSNAYVSPDPRFKNNLMLSAIPLLNSKNDEELIPRLEKLQQTVELFKSAELNPLSTIERRIKDKVKYEGIIF